MLWRSCIGPPSQPKLALNLPIKGPSFCRLTVFGGSAAKGSENRKTGHFPRPQGGCMVFLRAKPDSKGFTIMAPSIILRRHHHPMNLLNQPAFSGPNPLNPHAQKGASKAASGGLISVQPLLPSVRRLPAGPLLSRHGSCRWRYRIQSLLPLLLHHP